MFPQSYYGLQIRNGSEQWNIWCHLDMKNKWHTSQITGVLRQIKKNGIAIRKRQKKC